MSQVAEKFPIFAILDKGEMVHYFPLNQPLGNLAEGDWCNQTISRFDRCPRF
jgi:hypothetical protein